MLNGAWIFHFRLDQRQLGSDEAPPIGDRAAEPWPMKLSKYWSGCYHVSKEARRSASLSRWEMCSNAINRPR